MNGYLITFYTELNRKYEGKPIHEWLLHIAKDLNLKGATVSTDVEGLDRHGHLHSAFFFELADQPVQIQLALDQAETDILFQRLSAEKISIFYVKTPVELGMIGSLEE